ncbi:MAG: hypothetical protein HOQ24_19175 [Mycobacteriaceae bacterium]|nr:hypothetical protein [Mycobacteriaceae bacterium]
MAAITGYGPTTTRMVYGQMGTVNGLPTFGYYPVTEPAQSKPGDHLEVEKRLPSVTTVDNFYDRYSHSDMITRVGKIGLADIDNVEKAFKTAADSLKAGFDAFDSKIGAAIAEKWQGKSGTKAAEAIATYAVSGLRLVEAAYLAAQSTKALSANLKHVKDDMPDEPGGTKPGNFLRDYSPFNGWDDDRKKDAHLAAANFLTTSYYTGSIHQADIALPKVPQPQDPAKGDPTNGLPGYNPSSAGPNGAQPNPSEFANPNDPGSPDNPNQPGQPADQAVSTDDNTGDPKSGEDKSRQQNPNADGQVSAASADPIGGATGLGSGGAGGLGGGGLGSGGSALAAPTLGGNGIVGTPVSGVVRPAAAGRPGLPGMGAAGAGHGRKGDDDKEHKSADYLRGDHLGEWFDSMFGEKTAPPVLGVWEENEDGRPAS